ncbi:hypothetical protein D9757_005130 [Collybiopsis confluens]|uniref:Uncharacterized protein n=1 Tax=Collybiopsis confluens TaxID=2823264 RepID=A0A8H5HTE6_9AGAR|nr:hypothetical protein D9757_005130 [Collybiopsis confluens]
MQLIAAVYTTLLLSITVVFATPVPPTSHRNPPSEPGSGPNDYEMVEIHTPTDPLKITFAKSLPTFVKQYAPALAKYSQPQTPAEGTGGNQHNINRAAKQVVERLIATSAATLKLGAKPGSKPTFKNDYPFQNFVFVRQRQLYLITFNVEGGVCAPKHCAGFILQKEPAGSQGGDFGGEILDLDTGKAKYAFYSNPDLQPDHWSLA